jgi:hypothetical protein
VDIILPHPAFAAHNRGFAMFPNAGKEIADILRSPAMDGPTADMQRIASSSSHVCHKPKWHAGVRGVMPFVLSHILAVVTSRWMIYIILICR